MAIIESVGRGNRRRTTEIVEIDKTVKKQRVVIVTRRGQA